MSNLNFWEAQFLNGSVARADKRFCERSSRELARERQRVVLQLRIGDDLIDR